jgi:N,N'-diacetyllegionaminate synthase
MHSSQMIHLDGVEVGLGKPCYIIAEIGSNHNRDFATAQKLIDISKETGCNAVKFQSYSAEGLYSIFTPRISTMDGVSKGNETPFELIKRIEMPMGWHRPLKDYCDKVGITFCSTPFDQGMVDILEDVQTPFYKVASFEITHYPLLKRIAATYKPIVLSTGNSDIKDVQRAVNCLKENGCREFALLHCMSQYPAKDQDMNLRCIETLRQEFDCPVGLSDHTVDHLSATVAVGFGMNILEKHITLEKNYPGPDHIFALEPKDLAQLVKTIRRAEAALGTGIKLMRPGEEENHRIGRRSVIAAVNLKEGDVITEEKLVIKRPSFGIHPKDIGLVIGKKVNKDIERDRWITKEDIVN